LKIYQIDAFADEVFKGNPASVCLVGNTWPPDLLMQKIAAENNQAETAFIRIVKNSYSIRWFAPKSEVDLCGHATLAAAFVLFNFYDYPNNEISFSSKSGTLRVIRTNKLLSLVFPIDYITKIPIDDKLSKCFSIRPQNAFKGKTDILAVFSSEEEVRKVKISLDNILILNVRGIIITARGIQYDFVSRFFAPSIGINEDPVTGSAHTTLIPYWSRILNKNELTAAQLSDRGGLLICENKNDHVVISGEAQLYMEGEIHLTTAST
jgi:PhzF family phenazine biosynthesis protein